MLCDHMMKAKRLTNFLFPYVVLISKFIEYFGVNVESSLAHKIISHVSICTKWASQR